MMSAPTKCQSVWLATSACGHSHSQRELISSLEGKNAALENGLINDADEVELLKGRLSGLVPSPAHDLQPWLGEILTTGRAFRSSCIAVQLPMRFCSCDCSA